MSSTDSRIERAVATRWLRDPLLHFIVIGGLLFVAYAWLNERPGAADVQQIVLTEDDLLQMAVALQVQDLPPRGSPQFQSLIETKVREEVLYREALAMGLDQEDTIVKRRMAQKMDFLAEDLSTLREPTLDELHAWLEANPQVFAYPPRVTFRHIYFGFDQRGQQARDAAAETLVVIEGLAEGEVDTDALGDLFMFHDFYVDRTPGQLALEFGSLFAREVFELPTGEWSGPIESGFGWHLVLIDSMTPGRVPEFEEVENEVRAEWMANQRAEFKEEAYRVMREKYEVILPESVPAASN